MPRYIRIQLTEAQRQELLHTRAKAYMCERAAAVLKVAEGAVVSSRICCICTTCRQRFTIGSHNGSNPRLICFAMSV